MSHQIFDMDNLVIIAGILAVIRAYWVYNLLREEKGFSHGNFSSFLKDKNKYNMYLIIRPFHKKMKKEKLRKRINIISYIIYVFFIIGIVFIIIKSSFN